MPKNLFSRSACGLWLSLVVAVISGCAFDRPKESDNRPAENTSSVAPVEAHSVAPAPDKRDIATPQAASGFTIRETAGIDDEARADFERAMGYIKEENYENGIELLKRVAQRTPNATAPYINLAIAYQKVNNSAAAEDNIKKALVINPEHPLANNEYGMLQRRAGRFVQARETYEKTLQRYPGFLPARKNLAILCDLYLRDLECALKNYRLYSAAVPNDKTVNIWIADLEKRMAH